MLYGDYFLVFHTDLTLSRPVKLRFSPSGLCTLRLYRMKLVRRLAVRSFARSCKSFEGILPYVKKFLCGMAEKTAVKMCATFCAVLPLCLLRRANGTGVRTSAAVNALIGINGVLVAGGNRLYGTSVRAGSASDAFVRNFISHGKSSFPITRQHSLIPPL